MATTTTYGERVLRSIMEQCGRRGIPADEHADVLAHIEKRAGKAVTDMDERELRVVQRHLAAHFVSYLGGVKRRGGVETWPNASPAAVTAAAAAGILISDIEGTGKGGTVTKADVERAAG